MKRIGLLILTTWLATSLLAQVDYHVPDDYQLDSIADYEKHRNDAMRCYEAYLNAGFIEEDNPEHSQARAFGILWLAGHPDMRIELQSDAMPFISEEGELLYVFLFSAALAHQEAKGKLTNLELHCKALDGVLDFTEKDSRLKKLKSIKQLSKLRRKGRLEAWVEEQIKEKR